MTLHRIFIRNARKYGGKLALVDRTRNRRLTYSESLIASLILARKFRAYERGFVGIMLPTSAAGALASLGLLMSGRVPVMINFSGSARDNAIYAQKKCDFTTILTSRALLEKIGCPRIEGMVMMEDIMEGVSIRDKLTAALISKLPLRAMEGFIHKGHEDDDLVVLFTSGSEKEPKAVVLTHRNIKSNIESVGDRYDLSHDDIFLANLPFFHVFGITANLWAPFYFGMTAVSYASPIDYKAICEVIREEKPTLMTATPSFYWGYLRKAADGDFESLRIMISGADKCPAALREAYLEKHGRHLFDAYGTTETSPGISGNGPGANRPGSVGKPFKGVEVQIEHYATGEAMPAGEQGRILVRGANVMKGYFDDFEETAMRIRHGWYDTGDMGYLDEDGYLWHSGRLRRFVKIGGEMVSLVRVENALEELLPDDAECCVVELPDATKGSRIIAAVTCELDERAALRELSKKLANIELPKKFVRVEEFPKMGSGKIDFRTATDMVREMVGHHGH